MVVKVKGEFVWHRHDDTDDLFLVLKGRITIRLRDGDVELGRASCSLCPSALNTSRSLMRRLSYCSSSRAGRRTRVTKRPPHVELRFDTDLQVLPESPFDGRLRGERANRRDEGIGSGAECVQLECRVAEYDSDWSRMMAFDARRDQQDFRNFGRVQ